MPKVYKEGPPPLGVGGIMRMRHTALGVFGLGFISLEVVHPVINGQGGVDWIPLSWSPFMIQPNATHPFDIASTHYGRRDIRLNNGGNPVNHQRFLAHIFGPHGQAPEILDGFVVMYALQTLFRATQEPTAAFYPPHACFEYVEHKRVRPDLHEYLPGGKRHDPKPILKCGTQEQNYRMVCNNPNEPWPW
ncbi:hypothetical protein PM082_014617 [Marasmius tenuissimus]|nr:hypothetical protein PM082_014617 [Marasmius tenuissimus]